MVEPLPIPQEVEDDRQQDKEVDDKIEVYVLFPAANENKDKNADKDET